MYIDPTVYAARPADPRSGAEEAIYDKLEELGISYTRADHDSADTMEDCLAIEKVLGTKICKNLFLTNRQQTRFYLLLMQGEKPFKTKYLSAQLGCARLSFATVEHMEELLRAAPGSASALELLFDREGKVQLVIDRPLLEEPFLGAHPGRNTSTVKVEREELLRFVRSCGHEPVIVELPVEEDT